MLLQVVGFLVLFVGVLVSVMLHEAGHFATARRFGMKATQFFVGFGPTLWSTRRGETEYGVKALPVGGYVKIVGMTTLEPVEEADRPRAFFRAPAPQRAVVLCAGSFVHFLIAILVVFASVALLGVPRADAPVVGSVAPCVPAQATASCRDPGGQPAPAAGRLREGDRVLAVDGRPVRSWRDVVVAVRAAPGRPVGLTVRRGGQQRDVTLTPVAVDRPALSGGGSQRVGAVGVGPGVALERPGPVGVVTTTGSLLGQMVTGTWETLAHRLGSVTKLYSPDRDRNGLIGVVGAGRVSGEVLAAREPLSLRVLDILLMLAGLNLFVGLFNLLPLLPLDGGHVAVLAFEQARDGLRRVRGYRGPLQRVDLTKLMPVTYVVVAAFATVTVLLLGADIVNPVRLTQ